MCFGRRNFHKVLLFSAPALLLAAHMLATILYLLPVNPASKYYLGAVNSYMHPIFMQNWGLFAPEPATSSLQLWYRCQDGDEQWNEWKDPIHDLFVSHHAFPFTFRGKLTYIYQSMARDLLNTQITRVNQAQCRDQACVTEIERSIRSTKQFEAVARFTSDLCQEDEMLKSIAVQFQVVRVFPKPYSQRHDSELKGAVETSLFGPVFFGSAPPAADVAETNTPVTNIVERKGI